MNITKRYGGIVWSIRVSTFQKPLWNEAYPKITIQNQTKQKPEINRPFYIFSIFSKVGSYFSLEIVQILFLSDLFGFICLELGI